MSNSEIAGLAQVRLLLRKLMIEFILINSSYNARRVLGSQTFNYDLSSENGDTKIGKLCSYCLMLGPDTHLFFYTFHFEFWFNSVFESTESVTFQDAEGNMQKRNEATSAQGKQRLVCVDDWQ